jgi:uncharacterized tellurite resistance protein B-like protein
MPTILDPLQLTSVLLAERKQLPDCAAIYFAIELACNGVVIHITPTDSFRKYREQAQVKKLAGVNFRAITEEAFVEANKNSDYEFSGLFCFTSDPIPLLWVNL